MFSTILCAVDGSDTAETAMEMACDLAAMYAAELHLIHAFDYRSFLAGLGPEGGLAIISQEEFEKPRREILVRAKEKASELGCLSVNTHFVADAPASAINHTAENIDADLIVLGSKGHSDFSSLLIGSISHRVTNSAKCSCLVVR